MGQTIRDLEHFRYERLGGSLESGTALSGFDIDVYVSYTGPSASTNTNALLRLLCADIEKARHGNSGTAPKVDAPAVVWRVNETDLDILPIWRENFHGHPAVWVPDGTGGWRATRFSQQQDAQHDLSRGTLKWRQLARLLKLLMRRTTTLSIALQIVSFQIFGDLRRTDLTLVRALSVAIGFLLSNQTVAHLWQPGPERLTISTYGVTPILQQLQRLLVDQAHTCGPHRGGRGNVCSRCQEVKTLFQRL